MYYILCTTQTNHCRQGDCLQGKKIEGEEAKKGIRIGSKFRTRWSVGVSLKLDCSDTNMLSLLAPVSRTVKRQSTGWARWGTWSLTLMKTGMTRWLEIDNPAFFKVFLLVNNLIHNLIIHWCLLFSGHCWRRGAMRGWREQLWQIFRRHILRDIDNYNRTQ